MLRLLGTLMLASMAMSVRRDSYLNAYVESHGPSSMPPGEVYASDYPGVHGYHYPAPAQSPSYGVPAEPHSASLGNSLDPVHAKLVLLFKVFLKLLIFKLIVKFMAIICVFLFLPKLSGLGLAKDAMEDTKRIARTGKEDEEEQLRVTQLILDSISTTPVVCTGDSLACSIRQRLVEVDSLTSVPRLFRLYEKEEEDSLRHGVLKRDLSP